MARDPAARLTLSPLHPWAFILVGLGVSFCAFALSSVLPDSAGAVRVGLALAAVAVALVGVRVRLREAHWTLLIDRIETAAMIAVAGAAALVGWFSMSKDWDSGKTFFGALFVLSLAGTALVVLPSVGRKVFLSLFLLFHFGGMVTAVTSVDPPNNQGPWLSKQLWTYVYRPYLSFLYLTNAYHFYSPDPGPPTLLWFSVQYEDGSRTWVRLPERSSSAIGMQYQRNLALPEHTVALANRLPLSESELRWLEDQAKQRQTEFTPPPRGSWERIVQRRRDGSLHLYPATIELTKGHPEERPLPIPNVWGLMETVQYREPTDFSKKAIGSVARRIFRTAPRKLDKDGNEVPVKSVKVYRIVHLILTPQELARGVDPWDKTKHMPYFLGEHDEDGNLVKDGEMDPFLYWYLPMLNVERDYADFRLLPNVGNGPTRNYGIPASKETIVLDALEMHAAGKISENKKKGK